MSQTKYVVKFTTQFREGYKLAMKRGLKIKLLKRVVMLLAAGETLPEKNEHLTQEHCLLMNYTI